MNYVRRFAVLPLAIAAALTGCGGGEDGPALRPQYAAVAGSPVNSGSPGERIVQAKARACKALAAQLQEEEHAQFMNGCLANIFSTVVSFGDSLSDVGTYKVGTVEAVGGGKWTINNPTAMNWTEYVAAQFGAAKPCAAQTGLMVNIPGIVGASVTNQTDCTNYAQGRARVSNVNAPDSVALQGPPFYQTNLGFMAVPLTTQMSTHLAKVGGAYAGSELVTVWATGNDLMMQAYAITNAAAGGPLAVALAYAAGWPADVQAAVAGGGPAATSAAVTAGINSMGQAGAELASAVRTQILEKGARFVLVQNHFDANQIPDTASLDAQSRAIVTMMLSAFNAQLEAGLSGTPALLLDAYAYSQELQSNAQAYGFTNATTPACSATSPANPLGGLSLACTEASTVAGDTSGYLYSDGGHYTPRGYALWAEYVIEQMRTARWQ